MAELASVYIEAVRHQLAEALAKIEHCVSQLADTQVWWRPKDEMNSIANLMLHLAGNVRQWIICGIGGAKDMRNRPAEFSDRSHRSKGEVLELLRSTVNEADVVLAGLDGQKLSAHRRIQGFNTNSMVAVLDCVAHFRGHSQEIIHMTREQLGHQYRFKFVPKGPEQESAGRPD